MYSQFEKLLKSRNLKTADVTRATGIAPSCFTDWKKGRVKPKTDKLQKLADYFGVSISYFLGIDESELNEMAERASVVLDSPFIKLAKRIEALPADKRKSLEEYLCFLEQK